MPSTETLESRIGRMHEMSASNDWPAITRLAENYLQSEFTLSEDALSRVTEEKYRVAMRERMKNFKDARLLDRQLRRFSPLTTPDCAVEMLIRKANPFEFWPDMIPGQHFNTHYWEQHEIAAAKRFGMGSRHLNDICLQVIDTEWLHTCSKEHRVVINDVADLGMRVLAETCRNYGKHHALLTWEEKDDFATAMYERPVAEIRQFSKDLTLKARVRERAA